MSSLDGAFSLPEFSVPKFEPKPEPEEPEQEESEEPEDEEQVDSFHEPSPEPAPESQSKSPVVGPSRPPSDIWSERSGVSTALTTPGASEVLFGPSASPTMKAKEWAARNPPVISVDSEKRLPMPPPPTFADAINDDSLKTPTGQDRTPMAIEKGEPSFGLNLIPPTPPALESRQSFNASRAPSESVSAPLTEDALEGSNSRKQANSSTSTLKRSTSTSSKTSGTLTRTKSSSSSSRRKSTQQEVQYDGKGMLSLPAGLVATTVASSSTSRRRSSDETANKAGLVESYSSDGVQSPAKRKSKKSSKTSSEKKSSVPTSRSYSSFDASGAPGVPVIPSSMASELSSSTLSGSYNSSPAGSDGGGSVSPAPSSSGRAPSSSGRAPSLASDASSRELSPVGSRSYPKKIRTLSAGPTARPQLRMSAISEWESSAAHSAESPSHVSPAGSLPPSPYLNESPQQSYPALPPSTISRTSSAGSGVTPSVVRNAPMGASTNSYLHPPIPKSRRTSLDAAALDSDGEGSSIGGRNFNRAAVSLDGYSAPREWHSAASSNASAHSLASQSAASLPAVPMSSYRPHKDPVSAAGTIDERLYARTTMSTVTVSSGSFPSKSRSLRKRSSVHEGVNGSTTPSRGSLDIPDHLQDELNQTSISLTAHTPPPRKISSTQVLVQIIAVAVDEMDRLLLREKIRTETAYGFVPGRSFCGRVMEAGWDVKRMRKGDIIFGLQDSRKVSADWTSICCGRLTHASSLSSLYLYSVEL